VGKHCIWIPELGMKIIWSHTGKIEAFKDWDKGRNYEKLLSGHFAPGVLIPGEGWEESTLRSIVNEYEIMVILAGHNMAPIIGEKFHIKKFVSDWPYGVSFCDVRGRYGYEMLDANSLPKGSFEKGALKQIFGDNLEISDGAIGDVYKEDNIVNGYLIDIRRTIWDMMQLNLPYEGERRIPKREHDLKAIKAKVAKYGQFPFKERSQPYQSYYLLDEYVKGSRDTEYRRAFMHIRDYIGDNVLDLGCSIGSMATEAYLLGGVKVLGLDFQEEFVECARDIAMVNSFPINYVEKDLMNTGDCVRYIVNFFNEETVDVVFALSLFKHVKFKLFELLRHFKWKVCFLESNNAPDELETDHVKQMFNGIGKLSVAFGGKMQVHYLGQTGDRSPRCVWRLERE
jgi:ubiquinone/menaquinone biosynthesis C-methylase UbiE